MRFVKREPNGWKLHAGSLSGLFGPLCLIFFIVFLSGCASTVTQRAVPSHAVSFDGNDANSGIITQRTDGYVVTAYFVQRYNALIDLYGDRFAPAILKNEGVSNFQNNFLIDKQHMVYFLDMNGWKRMGKSPHGLIDKLIEKIK